MQLRFTKTALIWSSVLMAAASWSQAPDWSSSIKSYVNALAKKDQEMFKALRAADPRRENRSVIENYYDDVRKNYLADPFSDYQSTLSSSLGSYQDGLKTAAAKLKLKGDVLGCFESNGKNLNKDIEAIQSAFLDYSNDLQGSFNSSEREWSGASISRNKLQSAEISNTLSSIFRPNFEQNCCIQRQLGTPVTAANPVTNLNITISSATGPASPAATAASAPNTTPVPPDTFDPKSACSAFEKVLPEIQSTHLKDLKPPTLGAVPNPLHEKYDIDPDQLSVALRDTKTRHSLRKARRSRSNDKDMATTEDAMLFELSGCIKDAQHRQSKTRPTSTLVMEAIGKAVKCTLLPAIATYYWDTPYQKLTVGASAIPIEGKNWNVNCDPSETAMWDQMRITDPQQIQQMWGIPQMSNPPWVQGLRALPPITTPFPVVGVTAEDLIRGSPQSAFTPTTTPTTPGTVDPGNSRFRTGGGSTTTTRSGGADESGTGGGSRFRGQSQGRAFIQLTRATSSDIRRGKNAQKNSAQMASAARSTRNFFQNARRTVVKSDLSAGRKTIATSARRLVSISAGARASRTSSGSILSSIRSLPTRSNPNSSSGGSGGSTVSRREREAIGQQLKAMIDNNLANIKSSITAADEIKKEMTRLISERDRIVQILAVDILDKAPMKIADKVMAAQQKLLNLDAQLGASKAQWDVYDSAVREQTMFIQRVLTFGPNATGSGLPEISNFPNNYPAGIRGSSSSTTNGAFFRLFDFAEAWAAPAVDPSTHWVKELNRFIEEYADYASSRERADDDSRVAVANFLNKRAQRVEAEPMLWMDTDTLLSAQMFMGELAEESDYLVNLDTQGSLKLDEVSRSNMGEAKIESVEALIEVTKTAKDLLKAKPASYEDNSEVWLGMLPDLLMF